MFTANTHMRVLIFSLTAPRVFVHKRAHLRSVPKSQSPKRRYYDDKLLGHLWLLFIGTKRARDGGRCSRERPRQQRGRKSERSKLSRARVHVFIRRRSTLESWPLKVTLIFLGLMPFGSSQIVVGDRWTGLEIRTKCVLGIGLRLAATRSSLRSRPSPAGCVGRSGATLCDQNSLLTCISLHQSCCFPSKSPPVH